jgi:hypothetical protein
MLIALLLFILTNLFLSSLADYLRDKELGGARQRAGEAEEEEEEAEEAMPATPARKKKAGGSRTPPRRAPAPAREDEAEEEEEDYADDSDVDGLAEELNQMKVDCPWFHIEHKELAGVFAFVWTNPDTHIRFVNIRVEVPGSVRQEDFVRKDIINDGRAVAIDVKIKRGGELTNPIHLVPIYGAIIHESHPLWMGNRKIHRVLDLQMKEKVFNFIVPLPFRVQTAGFIDPLRTNQGEIPFGPFPLPNHPRVAFGPEPSTKFMFLSCQESDMPKVEQFVREQSFFTPPRRAGDAAEPPNQRRRTREAAAENPRAQPNIID